MDLQVALIFGALLVFGVVAALQPAMVVRWMTASRTYGLSERYWRHFRTSMRLIGIALVVGVATLGVVIAFR